MPSHNAQADTAQTSSSTPPRPKLPTWLVCVVVLLLQLGFILSFVGAFHAPHPHRIPVTVVGSPPVAQKIAGDLNRLDGAPVRAVAATDLGAARDDLGHGRTSGVLVPDQTSDSDTLLIASAGGTSVGTALTKTIGAVDRARGRTVSVTDAVPLQSGDGNGLTGFYLVVGWIIGGYLLAAVLGVLQGAKPAGPAAAARRLLVFVPYALASGILGAVVVGPVLGALHGDLLLLTAIGALTVMASAATTIALQTIFGIVGIAITIVIFVILGNPSAGGAYQASLLPPFWRAISSAIPNGAGTDAVRKSVYFAGTAIGPNIWTLVAYITVGVLITLVVSYRSSTRGNPPADHDAAQPDRALAAPST
ncbi:ABC transporter permease [Williamsia sterculiae]|uniref:DUF3533 domain-containing protein n=1 Tax=Williamsia sterculiae TaxID=1344003 RepID=A0A1N7DPY5_9NOCA|nr:ABC transporter permease [Williamsia sterculiae]SIR77745.1 hypothetical protein SAMN05445060_0808 [Williamsia sterculiae]